jgi:hypothetical protein
MMRINRKFLAALLVLATFPAIAGCEFYRALGLYDETPLTVLVSNETPSGTFRVVVTGPIPGVLDLGPGVATEIKGTVREGAVITANLRTPTGSEADADPVRCIFTAASMRRPSILVKDVSDDPHKETFYEMLCSGF